jgi:hypothetical protein
VSPFPNVEIFNYNILKEKPDVAVNRPGFGHMRSW